MSKSLAESIFNKIYNKNYYVLKNGTLSESLKHHIDNNIPLSETIYRMGSAEYFKLFFERSLPLQKMINAEIHKVN